MAFANAVVFTNRGKILQSKAQIGKPLHFTKIAIGDGELSGQSVLELTDLIGKKKELSISRLRTLSGGVASIGGNFTNQDVSTGFYWRELGLYATDPDIGEILYCYGNAGSLAEYIPAAGGSSILEKRVDIDAIIGNAENVSAMIDSSLVFATIEDIERHNEDETAHPFIKKLIDGISLTWDKISGKPTAFPPEAHGHSVGEVSGLQGEMDSVKTHVTAQHTATKTHITACSDNTNNHVTSQHTATKNTVNAARDNTNGVVNASRDNIKAHVTAEKNATLSAINSNNQGYIVSGTPRLTILGTEQGAPGYANNRYVGEFIPKRDGVVAIKFVLKTSGLDTGVFTLVGDVNRIGATDPIGAFQLWTTPLFALIGNENSSAMEKMCAIDTGNVYKEYIQTYEVRKGIPIRFFIRGRSSNTYSYVNLIQICYDEVTI